MIRDSLKMMEAPLLDHGEDPPQNIVPEKMSIDEQVEVKPEKKFGPKAVYKDGILGNFEPVPGERRTGPGRC